MQATTFEPVNRIKSINVWPFPSRVVHQEYGHNSITYETLGPVFSSFSLNCYPIGDSYLGPTCLELIYDGQPGIVKLTIPNKLINQISLPFEVIDSIDSSSHKSIPFERISKAVIHISVPKGDYKLLVNSGMNTSPGTTLVIETGLFGAGLWVPIFHMSSLLIGLIDKLRPKISEGRRTVLEKLC